MIRQIVEQVVAAIAPRDTDEVDAGQRETAIRLATAVLMIDVARADHIFEEGEFERILTLIEEHFDLESEAAAELVKVASDKAEDLTSVHDFTQLLHRHLDDEEKAHIVGLLWKMAYADGRLDKYEDSLVRKISDLLYVSRGRVMRLKHDAELATS